MWRLFRIRNRRHAFATRSFDRLPAGTGVSRHALALSTYLGQSNVGGTDWHGY